MGHECGTPLANGLVGISNLAFQGFRLNAIPRDPHGIEGSHSRDAKVGLRYRVEDLWYGLYEIHEGPNLQTTSHTWEVGRW